MNKTAARKTEGSPIPIRITPVAFVAYVIYIVAHKSQSFCSGIGSDGGGAMTGSGSGGFGAVVTRNALQGRVLDGVTGSNRPVNFCGLSNLGDAAGTSQGATPLNRFRLSSYVGIKIFLDNVFRFW